MDDAVAKWVEAVNVAQSRAEAAEAQRDDLLVAAERVLMMGPANLATVQEINLSEAVKSVRTAINAAAKRAFDAAEVQPACTRCGQPLGLKAFRVRTVDGERHSICPDPKLESDVDQLGSKAQRTIRGAP